MLARFSVVALGILSASCGRIGYDEIAGIRGPPSGALHQNGGSSALDAGSDAAGARNAAGGATGNGGTSSDAGPSGGGVSNGGVSNGGTSSTGGAPGTGGAFGSGGAAGNGGSPASGGSSGSDAAAGSGGVAGSGGSGGSGGVLGSGGSGGVVAGDAGIVGCADGQREGFVDTVAYPNIAACAGGFQVPGVVGLTGPACGRAAGDDGALPDGSGCNVEDLCVAGFHVCATPLEVGAKSSTGCTGAIVGTASVFYLQLQSGGGQQKCGAGTNDVFGCGNIGFRPSSGCDPLDRASGDLCGGIGAPWSCGSNLTAEALYVTKPTSAGGGVLCCRD